MVLDELHRGHIPDRTVSSLFIILLPPGFNHDLGFLQGQKPVLGQALTPKLAVETP